MIRLLLLILLLFIMSCGEVENRYVEAGKITSLRIDDDSEYHFSTDNIIENDVSKHKVHIYRCECLPTLYIEQSRCVNGICNSESENWEYKQFTGYKILLPYDYKIETFED